MFWNFTMRKENMKSIVDIVLQPMFTIVGNITYFGSNYRAAQLIKQDEVSIADFEPVKQMSGNIVAHARSLFNTWSQAQSHYEPLARSWEIISIQPNIGLHGGRMPNSGSRGALEFENVSFKYEEGPIVIKDMSFSIAAGSKCAMTGTSGAGKTTTFKLVERFYDPKEGRVLLDGVDIRDLNPVWVRRQMSIVDQRPRIFSLPLRDNLIFGCKHGEDPSVEQIKAACRAAGIYDFIFNNKDKFPAGLYTRISQHTLSGGELQRVAIARALLKNAPILLLDEATSSLDSQTQTVVKTALAKLMEGRTVVMIAHRLETIKEADQILVVREGTIKERGTHAELVALKGQYADLYEQQVTATLVNGGEQSDPNDWQAKQRHVDPRILRRT